MPKNFRFAHYLLAVEGIALMRSWLSDNEASAAKRIEEVTRICTSLEQLPQATEIEAYEVAPCEGYSVAATNYNQDQGTDSLSILERPVLLRLLASSPHGKALDAACGTGRQTQLLTALGHEVTGVDITPEMITKAREHIPQANYLLSDLNALPLEDASFDLVVCSLALTHISDISSPIKEFSRVTRRGGQIILSDIHPMQVILGGDAAFPFEHNKFVLVRNHLHLHSVYLQAFAQSGLAVQECVEPMFTPEAASLLWAAQYISEANQAAYVDAPAMLIWNLRKQI